VLIVPALTSLGKGRQTYGSPPMLKALCISRGLMKAIKVIFILSFIFILSSCSVNKYESDAQPVINQFLKHYNNQDFSKIAKMFRNGNPAVKKGSEIPLDQLAAYMSKFYSVYGSAIKLEYAGQEIAADTERGNEYVEYRSGKFQKGHGSIDFIFSIADGKIYFRLVAFGGELAKGLM